MSDIKKHLNSRQEYISKLLTKEGTPDDPIALFREWYGQAAESFSDEPNAMMLSTASANGKPSSRIVLLRSVDEGCFTFFTNYHSRKASQIEENPLVSLSFFWIKLALQIHIEGEAKKVPPEISDAYFETRPRVSQIGAWASEQSDEIKDRSVLEERVAHYKEKFKGQKVPRPGHWGGVTVRPNRMEFWQGREGRLHDRLLYLQEKDTWLKKRLSP